jgi:hypothetical protein
MALSKPELVLAEGRALDREARLRAAPEPRLLPRQLIDRLHREGGEHSAARLTFEARALDELLAELSMVNERAFKLAELDGNLRLELDIAERHRDRGAASDSQSKARIAADLSECVERATELRARSAALSARVYPLEQRQTRCRERIAAATRGGAPLRFMPPPAVDKLKLAVARERVLQIGADIKEIEAAPHTASEVKEIITRWVDEKLYAPGIGHLFDRGREASGVYLHGAEVANAWAPDLVGFGLWLGGRDEIIRRLHAEADRLADDAHALSDEQRVQKIGKCKAALLEAERVEECLAWQALQDGAPIVLRADADVRAILSIA